MSYKNKHNGRKYSQKTQKSSNKNNANMLPIVLILAVLPFIMKLKFFDLRMKQFSWFSNTELEADFFLYYKQWFFVIITFVMLLIIAYRIYLNHKALHIIPILIPLALYALLAILSTIFSDYASYSLKGNMGHYESIFVLLGYCTIVLYAYLFIDSESDVKLILRYFVISIVVFIILGIGQYIGKDLFASELGKKLITPRAHWNVLDTLTMSFEKGRVYLTLYNPNYVGVYVTLVAPIILTLLIFSKKLIKSILYIIIMMGFIVLLIGSQSLSGMIGLGFSLLGIFVFMWRYLYKKIYIIVPVIILIMATLFIVNKQNDNFMFRRVSNMFNIEKAENSLTNIETGKDYVSFHYKGNEMRFVMNLGEEDAIAFSVTDREGLGIDYTYNIDTDTLILQDERFLGITFAPVLYEGIISFYVRIDGYDWLFTNQTEDGTYYHHNRYGKLDKIVMAPSALFTGYEHFASGRGYLWSRTIPLLKNNIILGSGPDTFIFEYPQQDYLSIKNYAYGDLVITKPHNLYLQIAVQTGLISMIAFIVFYAMYFVSSLQLYIRGRFNNFYSQLGLGILMGTFGYMICGLSNDSSITVAPIFWSLVGIGIVVNRKAKPLIIQERDEIKENKTAMKDK